MLSGGYLAEQGMVYGAGDGTRTHGPSAWEDSAPRFVSCLNLKTAFSGRLSHLPPRAWALCLQSSLALGSTLSGQHLNRRGHDFKNAVLGTGSSQLIHLTTNTSYGGADSGLRYGASMASRKEPSMNMVPCSGEVATAPND